MAGLRFEVKAEEYFETATLGLPNTTVGAVSVYGCEVFTDEVATSLELLKAGDQYGYRLVQRYVRAVVEASKRHRSGQLLVVRYQRTTEARRLPFSLNRFAALLVRDAVVTGRIRGLALKHSPKADVLALTYESRTMLALSCHPKYIEEQKRQLARAISRVRATRPWTDNARNDL